MMEAKLKWSDPQRLCSHHVLPTNPAMASLTSLNKLLPPYVL